jgi:transposase InsO family protein
MDLTGPYPKYRFYILLVVDCFTKYLWYSIQPSKHAALMADALLEIFEREKVVPQILQYDNGKEFMGKVAQVLKNKGMKSK